MRSILQSSYLYYLYKRRQYYNSVAVTPELTDHKEYLGELLEHGIVVLQDFFDPLSVETMRDEISPFLDLLRDGRYSENTRYNLGVESGTYRIYDVPKISPASRIFFDNSTINAIARAYVSKDVTSWMQLGEIKCDVGKVTSNDWYHVDDWRHRFKAFVYLTDVTDGDAPFVFYKGSHNIHEKWHRQLSWHRFRYGRKGSYGYLSPDQMKYICRTYGHEKVICTGSAGTVILFDGRGIHRGLPPRSGHRILLANYFDVQPDGIRLDGDRKYSSGK